MRTYVALIVVALLTGGLIAAEQAAQPSKEEGVSLFNGKDLTGWEGDPKFWKVEDGAITGQTTSDNPTRGNTFLIWRGGKVGDFELRLKFRMEGGNTGIQYRSRYLGNFVVNGYQADYDASRTYAGILYEEGGRGILANVGQKVVIGPDGKVQVTGTVGKPDEIRKAIKDKEWNDYVIIAKGNHLQHIINGNLTADVTDEQVDKRAMEGILAFQVHAGPPMKVQFKDIVLKAK